MLETLFIIGREPELSAAELESIAPRWGAEVIDVVPAGVLMRHSRALPTGALNLLGGSIKQVDVTAHISLTTDVWPTLLEHCTATWVENFFSENRVEYGVSGYGLTQGERAKLQKHFLALKKEIHATGRPVRFVISREPQLSAVTVQRNGLLKKGKEFIVFRTSTSLVVGVTAAVQDYRAYGLRDFGRPAANPKSGMVPPKLAQMMLNIAQVSAEDTLLDPFCGSGTILQEAALFGVQKIFGSDSDPATVKSSQENLRWLLKEFPALKTDIEMTKTDAREVRVRPSVIVTEPYLGKPLRGHEPKTFLAAQKAELERLYLQCFQHWKNVLPPGGRVVMIWPEYVVGTETVGLNIDLAISGIGFVRQPLLSPEAAVVFNLTDTTMLTYSRDDARVRRQIRKWSRA